MANYLDKKELNAEIKKCKENKQISNKLCSMLYLISSNMARSYVFDEEDKNDMIQKSVEFCIKYFKRIDVEKDAFSYVTQICKHAFYQFFNSENKYKKFISEMLTKANKNFEKKYKNK